MTRISARALACAFVLVCLAMVPVFDVQAQTIAPGTGRAGVSSKDAWRSSVLTSTETCSTLKRSFDESGEFQKSQKKIQNEISELKRKEAIIQENLLKSTQPQQQTNANVADSKRLQVEVESIQMKIKEQEGELGSLGNCIRTKDGWDIAGWGSEADKKAIQKKAIEDVKKAKRKMAIDSRYITYSGNSSDDSVVKSPFSRALSATVNKTVDTDDITFEISNGTNNYEVKISVSGTVFEIAQCPGWINASHPCTVPITFKPTSAGVASEKLTATFNDESNTTVAIVTVPLHGIGTDTCRQSDYAWLPLTHADVPKNVINCFYNANGAFDFVSQVQYAYNPQGNVSAIGADLFSVNFVPGVQVALGGTGSTSTCKQDTSTSSSTASSCGNSSQQASSNTVSVHQAAQGSSDTASVQQAAQALQKGGDFYTRITYPILNWRWRDLQALSIFSPRVGFTVSEIGDQNIGTGTNVLTQIAGEFYLQYDAIARDGGRDAPAAVFIDWRPAFQNVNSEFQKTAGLEHQNFHLSQLALGIAIKGGLTLSGQRFFGPKLFYVDGAGKKPDDSFGGWQVRVALSPKLLNK